MRMRSIKPWWVIAAFFSGLAFAMFAEELILTTHESRLEFAAPRVHFLVGKPLERLRNALEVPFDFKITLWSGTRNHKLREAQDRFVVSYDLFEETFSVTKLVTPRRTARHLTNTGRGSVVPPANVPGPDRRGSERAAVGQPGDPGPGR